MTRLRILMVLFVVVSGIAATLLASFAPARAEQLGPGHVAMPGFSGYVSRDGGELGIGRLGNGAYGVCLDTGPDLHWPAGTPGSHLVTDPRAAYLLATYTGTARRDGEAAAALWWALGGGLRLNSHPERVAQHVAQLRRENPATYRVVARWHARMMRAAATLAPPASGYRAPKPELRNGRVGGLGVRSGTGHWVPGAAMTVRVSGTALATGGHVWHGTTSGAPRQLRLKPATRVVRVTVSVTGLAGPAFRLYDGGGTTQRVATRVAPVTVRSAARMAAPRVPLVVTKSDETGDPTGMVGVGIAVHRGGAAGPVVATHTFTRGEISAKLATHTFRSQLVPGRHYTVTITHEPAGWIAEHTAVAAVPGRGRTLRARLVDDKIWQPALSTRASSQNVRAGATLYDTVSVTSTGGDTLTGSWRLLGPLAPGAHGCAGLAWGSARVAAHGTFTVSGDGSYRTGQATVTVTGCYTYVESLAGDTTTLPVAWTTPGQQTETVLVRSTPRLRTHTSRQRATAGATLLDRVRVSGLDAGSASARVPARWQLLGPVAPRGTSCHGLRWSHAPVVAGGRFTVRRDGTVRVGRHRLAEGGCYTYRERLRATATSTATAWTTPGIATETATVSPRMPLIPRFPQVPAGGDPAGHSSVTPVSRVRIASVGLDAGLLSAAFHGSDLTPPADLRDGAVWRDGAPLDAVVGTTVLVGHVSDDHDRPGEFHRLDGVRRGQTILTTTHGTTTRWRVTKVWLTPKRRLPRSVFEQGMARRLVLITCGNEIHYADGHFHYRSNLVVQAVPR